MTIRGAPVGELLALTLPLALVLIVGLRRVDSKRGMVVLGIAGFIVAMASAAFVNVYGPQTGLTGPEHDPVRALVVAAAAGIGTPILMWRRVKAPALAKRKGNIE